MCDHTAVIYTCGCSRYIVKAWCTKYQEKHIPCSANAVEVSVSVIFIDIEYHEAKYNVDAGSGNGTQNAVRRSV